MNDKPRLLPLALLLIIAASAVQTEATSPQLEETMRKVVQEVELHAQRNETDQVIKKLDGLAAQAEQARDDRVMRKVAQIYAILGLTNKEGVMLEKAIALNPQHAGAHADLAVVYGQQGKMDKAIAEAEKSVQLAPNDLISVKILAELYLKQGRMADGRKTLAKLITLAKKAGDQPAATEAAQLLDGMERLGDERMKQLGGGPGSGTRKSKTLPNSTILMNAIAQQPAVTTQEPIVTFMREQDGADVSYVVPVSVALVAGQALEAAGEVEQAIDIYQAVLQSDSANPRALERLKALSAH